MNSLYTPYIISTFVIIFFIGINTYIIEEDELTWDIITKQFIILFILVQGCIYVILNVDMEQVLPVTISSEKSKEFSQKVSDPNSIYLGPPKFNRF